MLKIDAASIVMAQAYVAGASTTFGETGRIALSKLFDSVRTIYSSRPPEFINSAL